MAVNPARAALKQLSDRQYQVALLRIGEGMTWRQIGKKLKILWCTAYSYFKVAVEKYPELAIGLGRLPHSIVLSGKGLSEHLAS